MARAIFPFKKGDIIRAVDIGFIGSLKKDTEWEILSDPELRYSAWTHEHEWMAFVKQVRPLIPYPERRRLSLYRFAPVSGFKNEDLLHLLKKE